MSTMDPDLDRLENSVHVFVNAKYVGSTKFVNSYQGNGTDAIFVLSVMWLRICMP